MGANKIAKEDTDSTTESLRSAALADEERQLIIFCFDPKSSEVSLEMPPVDSSDW